jgi:eukaryotic-like serine/threonine-protein kinase
VKHSWEQVKDILHQAAELPPAERGVFVAQASAGDPDLQAEVESLLESLGEADDFLESAPIPLLSKAMSMEGRSIGPYRVERILGEGGMGSVYLATRELDGFPMRVALKVIRFSHSSEYLQRRFRLERQILARLSHENILRLLDGGITEDGAPYLVTEFLDARSLEHYLSEERPSREERLRLFLGICDGVAYAHRNLVVHGDLKPSNILINAAGTPKLVDFGIAKLLKSQDDTDSPEAAAEAQATITLMPALTPFWASPEQLRGEPLSIVSDIYGLGRILFYLLTQKLPFDLSGLAPSQIVDKLRQSPVPRPSDVAHDTFMEGDLDNIVRKALEFEGEQRYQSADAFGEDIRRHLEQRPVSARPYTVSYRAAKFIRRNRGLVAIVSIASIALILAMGVALWQARVAKLNYDSARERFEQLRVLSNSLIFDTDEALAQLQGSTPVRAKLVKSAIGYLDILAKADNADPRLQEELAAAYEKIADILGRPGTANLGQSLEAMASYRKTEAIREKLRASSKGSAAFQESSDRLATTYARLSGLLRAMGDVQSSLTYERKALGIRQAMLENDPGNATRKRALASSLTSLSGSLSQLGDWPGVLDTRREALRMYEELATSHPENSSDQRGLSLALLRMGSILLHENHLEEAVENYRLSLRIEEKLAQAAPGNVQFQVNVGRAQTSLAVALLRNGEVAQALATFEAGRAAYERAVQPDKRDVRTRSLMAANRAGYANALLQAGRLPQALPVLLATLAAREELTRQDPANAGARGEVAETHSLLARLHQAQGQKARALEQWNLARAIYLSLRREGKFDAVMGEEWAAVSKELGQAPTLDSAVSAAPANWRSPRPTAPSASPQ